jgi:hypothetical protein
MDHKLSDCEPKFHASHVIIMPPLAFLVGWGATKLYVLNAGKGELDWRAPVGAGFILALLSLGALVDNAAPRSLRGINIFRWCSILYGTVLVGLYVLLNEGTFSLRTLGVAAAIAIVIFVGHRRMVRAYKDKLAADLALQ